MWKGRFGPRKDLEMKHVVIEVKNSMKSLNNILDIIEELVNKKGNLKKLLIKQHRI